MCLKKRQEENHKDDDDEDVKVSKKETIESTNKSKTHKISKDFDVRDQQVAVVSFIKDTADVPEFFISSFWVFENENDANVYVRNTCGDKVQDFDIDTISTCQWAFPQQMTFDKASKEEFRSEELNNIMKNHRSQPQQVQKFNDAMKKDEEAKESSAN